METFHADEALAVPVDPAAAAALREAFVISATSLPVLVIYSAAQAALGLGLAAHQHQHQLKLMVEPYLLLLGLILHVQWRRVARNYRGAGLPRPGWVAACDCVSFVTTFWAFWAFAEACLRAAKVL
jgi:hypothetical protein